MLAVCVTLGRSSSSSLRLRARPRSQYAVERSTRAAMPAEFKRVPRAGSRSPILFTGDSGHLAAAAIRRALGDQREASMALSPARCCGNGGETRPEGWWAPTARIYQHCHQVKRGRLERELSLGDGREWDEPSALMRWTNLQRCGKESSNMFLQFILMSQRHCHQVKMAMAVSGMNPARQWTNLQRCGKESAICFKF